MRKIGFLGGSFDPVHKGHVQLALAAAQALTLDEVRFIPAAQSWQKDAPGASGEQRVAMLQLALAPPALDEHATEYPTQHRTKFSVDQRELTRGGLSYTIDTARELRCELGPDVALFMLLGADQFLNLQTWREWPALFELLNLAVAGRPGYELNQAHWPAEIVGACASRLVDPSTIASTKAFGAVHLIEMAPADVSATALRAALKAGAAPALLPATVLDYIARHHLYLS